MSEVAVIGALPLVGGFALAGACVFAADTAEQARAAWAALPGAIGVVVLTETAAEALVAERASTTSRLTIVLPT